MDHRAEEGRWGMGKSGSAASKTSLPQSPHPTMPERLETKERRNNFRWVLTECDLLLSKKWGGKKAFHNGSNNSFVATVKMMQITCE